MADNVQITAGTGTAIAADEVTDGTLGSVKVQYVKLMDGTLDGTTKASVGANGLKVDGSAVTQPVSGSLTTVSTVTNVATIAGTAPAFGSGVTGSTVLRTALATDSPGIIATGTPGTAATTAVLSVQGVASMTPVITTQAATATANGQTSSRVNAAASTNATSLKASAGNIGEIDVYNAAAYTVFLKLYNKASAPTVGTDTPVWTIPVAAGGGFSKSFPRGKSFATGIAYAITKLQADSDTTVVVAGDLTGSIDWI